MKFAGVWLALFILLPFSLPAQEWNLGFHGLGSLYPDPSGEKLPTGKVGGFRDLPWRTDRVAVIAKEKGKPAASTPDWLLYKDRLLGKECLVNYDFDVDRLVEGSYSCQFHAPYGASEWKTMAVDLYRALRSKYGKPSYETLQALPLGEIRAEEGAFGRFFEGAGSHATQVAWHFRDDFVHFDVVSSPQLDIRISYGVNEAEQLRAIRDEKLRPPKSRAVAGNLEGKL